MAYPARGAWLFYNVTKAAAFTPTLESILISQELPDMTATLSCRVVDATGSQQFDIEDQVRVTFDGSRIWAGHLKSVTHDRLEEFGPRVYDLEGQDYTAKLSDAIVTRRKKRKKEKALRRVRWLLRQLDRRVWQLSGRDLSHIPDEMMEGYDYYGASVDEGLAHVADELRLHYFIDLDNVFQIYRQDAIAAPFDLDNDGPDLADTFPFREYSDTDDSVELANVILVEPEKRKHSKWAKDATSIAAYGRQERFLSDSNLHRKAQALATANRTLADTKDPEQEAKLVTWQPGLQAGMKLHLTEALWSVDADRYISAVDISAVDPHDADGKAYLKTEATLLPLWKRKRRPAQHGVNKNARRRPGQTSDVDLHTLDDFSRTVAAPSWEAGGSISATLQKHYLKRYYNRYGDGYPNPYLITEGPAVVGPYPVLGSLTASSYIGNHATRWPDRPPEATCAGRFWFAGWTIEEAWYRFTVPAHPAGMAGITFSFGPPGVHSRSGVSQIYGVDIVAASAAPTDVRQGSVIAHCPPGETVDVFIPGGLVGDEGASTWIGVRSAWEANYGNEYCGTGDWPKFTGVENSGYAGVPTPTALAWATWVTTGASIGTTAEPEDAPWQGGNVWHDDGIEGSPVFGIDGSALYVEGNGGHGWSVYGEREDEDEEWGPWSDVSWGAVIEFDKDADGSAGTASITLTTTGEGEQAIGIVHLGDGMTAEGISVAAPTATEYAAFSMSTATRYAARFDCRSGKMRGKLWAIQDREPTEWNVEVPMEETEDDADRFSLWIRARAGQTIRVHRIQAQDDARDGRRVEREWLGIADGVTNRFPTCHPYRKGTLVAFVNGVRTPPIREDGDGAQFWLDCPPTAGMTVRASYVADQGG